MNTSKTIEDAVFKGIRTTINRFREHPFLYFTESDIHSSLKADIIKGNSSLFYKFLREEKKLQISLVHLEYPTNFIFSRKDFKEMNIGEEKNNKQRGNFDLVVLNPSFIAEVSENDNKLNLLRGVIAKDNKMYYELHNHYNFKSGNELLFIIEVKFRHLKTSKAILDEIQIDNFKLSEALKDNSHIIPIVLIFCYTDEDSKNKIDWKKRTDIYQPNILNIFIETAINDKGDKETMQISYLYIDANNRIPIWVTNNVAGYKKLPL